MRCYFNSIQFFNYNFNLIFECVLWLFSDERIRNEILESRKTFSVSVDPFCCVYSGLNATLTFIESLNEEQIQPKIKSQLQSRLYQTYNEVRCLDVLQMGPNQRSSSPRSVTSVA